MRLEPGTCALGLRRDGVRDDAGDGDREWEENSYTSFFIITVSCNGVGDRVRVIPVKSGTSDCNDDGNGHRYDDGDGDRDLRWDDGGDVDGEYISSTFNGSCNGVGEKEYYLNMKNKRILISVLTFFILVVVCV